MYLTEFSTSDRRRFVPSHPRDKLSRPYNVHLKWTRPLLTYTHIYPLPLDQLSQLPPETLHFPVIRNQKMVPTRLLGLRYCYEYDRPTPPQSHFVCTDTTPSPRSNVDWSRYSHLPNNQSHALWCIHFVVKSIFSVWLRPFQCSMVRAGFMLAIFKLVSSY